MALIFIFYAAYFTSKNNQINSDEGNNIDLVSNENSLIKNLKYEININNQSQYNLSSELSEIIIINDIEIVKMKKVKALFINKNSFPLTIYSDNADYNINTHKTTFMNNVKIQYLNNTINSEKLDFSVDENIIHISNKVKYAGDLGVISTDNLRINLITKKIDIYMNDNTDRNVKIFTSN